MINLYLDGFRGFEKTYLPLRDVNFFVGENSTGKTSVLAAIQILSEPRFWVSGSFRSENVDLGSFWDIAPSGSKFFRIGFYSQKHAALLTFTPGKGTPLISSLQLSIDSSEQRIVRQGDSLFIRFSPSRPRKKKTSKENRIPTEDLFKNWLDQDPFDIKNSEKVKFREGIPMLTAPFWNLNLGAATRQSEKSRSADEELQFFMPFITPTILPSPPVWIAPIRAKPQRTYDNPHDEYSPEGAHLPHLLERIFNHANPDVRSTVQEYGHQSGLFREVGIHHYGDQERAPLEITVDLGGIKTSILNSGYGVSQVLPIVTEIASRKTGTWFVIQQPEVHLHPRAQAAIGELIFIASKNKQKKRFLIETHSDFVIDRFRASMRRSDGNPPSAQVIFFHRRNGKNELYPLEFSNNGEYPEQQPADFRDFFLQEELRNLGF